MKTKKTILLVSLLLLWAAQAWAAPVLQVGAPAGIGEVGTYADYIVSLSDPTEEDSAVTSGGTLYVAGLYANKDVVSLGGQSNGSLDWTDFGLPIEFSDKGAILVATVPEAQFSTGTLTVNGVASFYSSLTDSFFPNNHAPTNAPTSAYFFFDIGEFSELVAIPDFADESLGDKLGEIKTLTIAITDFDWVHFDVMALQTDINKQTTITTTLENNPGSHDVTWKDDGGGGTGDPVPEPGTIVLVGAGLVGLALLRKKQSK